jgi:peptide/nickel transport system permease protein
MVFVASILINFAIPRLMPGSPIEMLSGGVKLDQAARVAIIKRFGLDATLWEQFYKYFIGIFKGDFGVSFAFYPMTVWDIVMEALPWTVLIMVPAVILQGIIGFFMGVTAGWRAGSKLDSFLQTFSLIIISTPIFWIAMMFLYFFAFVNDWFPLSGCYTEGAEDFGTLEYLADITKHAALPIITFTISQYAMYQLVLRNTMVTTLKEHYIMTATAKGLSENRIKYFHAARNSLLPMITMLGLSLVMVIGASVFIESIFSYSGLGRLLYDSVIARDYPVVQGCFLIFSVLIILANFIVDLLYMVLDPRVRY